MVWNSFLPSKSDRITGSGPGESLLIVISFVNGLGNVIILSNGFVSSIPLAFLYVVFSPVNLK